MARRVLAASAALLMLAAGVGAGVVIERYHLGGAPEAAASEGAGETTDGGAGERKILYWVAPMDPNFRRDGPGKSPMGMDLIPVYEGEEPGGGDDAGTVKLSPAMVHNLGVRTADAAKTDLRPSIETFGTIAFDETKTSHVHVRAEGWIERLVVRSVGEPIEEGQVLFEMFSPELATAAWEYVRELERGDARMYAGGRRKLLALGVHPRQVEEIRRSQKVPDLIKVYAPRAGVAVALNVAEGMYVTPAMTTVSITDPSKVWLFADVFESQAAFVREGMAAEARIAGMPDQRWRGTVDYVYPDLRPETRTVRVRLTFDNPDLALKPNMYADVSLLAAAEEDVLSVPQGAVIRTGRSSRVVLALGDGRFKAVPVRLGRSVGDRVEILEGLSEGDRVVTSAQFLIDSESSLMAGFAQMEDAEPEAKTGPDSEPAGEPVVRPVAATGRIESVDAAARKATVTHEPIPALGWPAMTMDFALGDDIDPGRLHTGDEIAFDLVNAGPGVFAITAIRSAVNGRRAQPEHGLRHADAGESDAVAAEAWTEATVHSVEDGTANVSHEPIPALGWPAMTMDLAVAPSVANDVLVPGERARIGLAKGTDGLFRIVAVDPLVQDVKPGSDESPES